MSVFFPAGTFIKNFNMNFDVKDDILYLHDETTPVHSSFTITMK
jgi:capsule polysaccharide modification protein KpsS